MYRIEGAMAELDAILEDEWSEIEDEGLESIGEIFIDRIELGHDACGQPVPEGYGENGIWVRGAYDYAQPRVAGAIGSGRYSTMIAWIGEATWVEHRIALVDAVRQVEEVRAEGWWLLPREPRRRWQDIDEEKCFRYVNWIGARGLTGPRSAPPLRMRLRCWYEIVIETEKRKRIVLREKGLRGDDARTVARAIDRWRKAPKKHANRLVVVREVRIAKSQPRPMAPRETSRAVLTGESSKLSHYPSPRPPGDNGGAGDAGENAAFIGLSHPGSDTRRGPRSAPRELGRIIPADAAGCRPSPGPWAP